MLVGKGIELVDSIAEGTGVSDVLPSKSCQTSYNSMSVVNNRSRLRLRTAERCDGSVDWLDQDTLAMKLLCKVSLLNLWARAPEHVYLIAVLCIQQNPAKLDDLSRVLGDIDSVLVTGGGYMNNDISVQVRSLWWY